MQAGQNILYNQNGIVILCAIIKERKFLRIRAIINGDDFPDELADGIEALINKDLF